MTTAFTGQQVLILGLGASGLAMARWCANAGARVTVADSRAAPPQLDALRAQLHEVRFVSGPFSQSLVDDLVKESAEGRAKPSAENEAVSGLPLAAVYRSPGLTPAQIASVLEAAAAHSIKVSGELELFSEALAELKAGRGYAPAVLAVTGTNGKTTVTALAGQLVERSGKTVAVAGNIGPTLLDTLARRIEDDALPEVWVLELSSFQLDCSIGFEPTAAAVLNITQDHLDWHGSLEAYAAAKARIFGTTALMVLNREDAAVMAMLPEPVKQKSGKQPGGKQPGAKNRQRRHVTFGADMPRRPGDFGIEVANGMRWLVRALEADETRRRGQEEEQIHIQRLMPADALRIRGRHNALNALSALALAVAAGCALGPMLHGLREYRGEPHRVELIARVDDIDYFDDSKGTNVGATVAALEGLAGDEVPGASAGARKLVVILGGDGKGQDFTPLAAPVGRHARAVVLIGRDAALIRAVLGSVGVNLLNAASMEEAVALAADHALPGDAVLLSPACASFDMFKDYSHRADVFRAAVHGLADDAGVLLEGAV